MFKRVLNTFLLGTKPVKHFTFNSFMTGTYHIDTSLLICSANQWTGFYMIETSVMKKLLMLKALQITNLITRMFCNSHVIYISITVSFHRWFQCFLQHSFLWIFKPLLRLLQNIKTFIRAVSILQKKK